MTNSTSTQVSKNVTANAATNSGKSGKRPSALRRGIAGLVAATSIAFGGTSLLSATEAQAAGVQATNYTHTYAVTTDAVKVSTGQVRVRA